MNLVQFVKAYTMVDNTKLKSYIDDVIELKNRDDSKISNNSFLDTETLNLLQYANKNGVLKEALCTDDSTKGFGYSYQLDAVCKNCGHIDRVTFSKTQLLSYIDNECKHTCNECRLIELDKQKSEHKILLDKQKQERQKIKESNTKIYIDTYLNPENSWINSIPQYKRMKIICHSYIDDEQIANYIKSELCYADFLLTPYWKAIAQEVKKRANFECQLCGSSNNLATHHKTYINHGYEHRVYRDGDLIVLCEKCHKKFHNIVED